MKFTTRHLIAATAAAALTVAGVNCAPVDAPGPEDAKTTSTADPAPSAPLPPPPTPLGDDWTEGLKGRVDAAIDQVKHRDLLTTHGFWTVFHGILGLGPSVELVDPASGKRVVALDVETRPGTFVSQGHQDQFVAEMVEWGVSPERKFLVNGEEHPFMDFVRYSRARASVTDKQELDWAVVIIGTHYGTDAVWTNALGQTVHFEDLIRYQLDAPMESAACGGTHRLFGLTWVYHLHLLHGGKTTGVWKEVADRLAQYQKTAHDQQSPDGSFSTNYFRGKGAAPEAESRISTTGHILEWLSLEETDEELRQPWMRDAANALSIMILDSQGAPREGGSLYHAVHGLLIYRARVFGDADLGPNAPHEPLLPNPKDHLPLPLPVPG